MLLAVALAGSACVTTGPTARGRRPSWMDNPHAKYPLRYYITAMGEGDTLDDAQSVAVGNLAKVFRSDVSVDETLRERYVELMGKRNSYQEQTQFDRNVRVRSGLSLVNVQYADSYTDQTGRVYVLAFINRARTAEIYATRLIQNNTRTHYFVGQSAGASPAVAYAALSAATAVSADSQVLLEQLDVISPATKKATRMTYEHDALSARLAEAAGNVRFHVRVDGDRDGKVAAALEALMTDLGFVVSGEAPVLRVQGKVTFADTDLKRDGLSFVRFEVKLDVVDEANCTVASVAGRGREGHVSKPEAQARCVRSIVSLVDSKLRPKLLAYFDGLVMGQ